MGCDDWEYGPAHCYSALVVLEDVKGATESGVSRVDDVFTALPGQILKWLVVLFVCIIVLKYLRYRRAQRRQKRLIENEVTKQLEKKYYKR